MSPIELARCAAYFEVFLPRHVPRSQVARVTAMSATVRFAIDRMHWICRFDQGQLAQVVRGAPGVREDFGYRASRDAFWQAISGRVELQELFASGRAEIFGDVEQGLKMAVILGAFSQEFPCTPEQLANNMEASGHAA
jgi:hypothetical protein